MLKCDLSFPAGKTKLYDATLLKFDSLCCTRCPHEFKPITKLHLKKGMLENKAQFMATLKNSIVQFHKFYG